MSSSSTVEGEQCVESMEKMRRIIGMADGDLHRLKNHTKSSSNRQMATGRPVLKSMGKAYKSQGNEVFDLDSYGISSFLLINLNFQWNKKNRYFQWRSRFPVRIRDVRRNSRILRTERSICMCIRMISLTRVRWRDVGRPTHIPAHSGNIRRWVSFSFRGTKNSFKKYFNCLLGMF